MNPSSEEKPVEQRPAQNSLHANHKVLIISRSAERIQSVSRQLYHEKYYCLKEYGCGQAIETLNLFSVGVILIDIDIPLTESRCLIEWLEENRPSIRLFLINGSDMCYELHHPGTYTQTPVSFSSVHLTEAMRQWDMHSKSPGTES